MRKITFEEFERRAKERHKSKYKYLKETYKNTSSKVGIICPIHGSFSQNVNSHLRGCECPSCYNDRRSITQQFNKADVIKKFDYKKSGSIMLSSPVAISMVLESKTGYVATTIRLFDEIKWSDNESIDYFMLGYDQDDDLLISSTALSPVDLMQVFDQLRTDIQNY